MRSRCRQKSSPCRTDARSASVSTATRKLVTSIRSSGLIGATVNPRCPAAVTIASLTNRGLAETCAGTGVTVNSVLPGPTLTEGAKDFLDKLATEQGKSFDELVQWFFANARPTSLLRRFIEPKEVAAMVAYVCSPLSAATNGAALRVDGGVVRSLI